MVQWGDDALHQIAISNPRINIAQFSRNHLANIKLNVQFIWINRWNVP
jgi:hypothetical protein